MGRKKLLKQAIHLIDNWLNFQVYLKEIPGISIGIFVEDEIIFKKEYGYSNLETKEKLTNQHLFRIASHSKLFTATAIMKLYHGEKLSLDDKISKFLPWFTSEKDENINQIRIRHLLTHSSGMTRDGTTAHWYNHKFPSLEEIKNQTKEGISFFQTSEILKYSNFGYTLLGQIIEAASGQSYADYIQNEILLPLDMKNTIIDVSDENISRHATGYKIKYPNQEREPFKHIPARIMHSATGLSSTVEDLIKFYRAHIFGNNVLFPDYIKREMQRVQFKAEKTDWGLGFNITELSDCKIVGHGGGYPGFITRSGLNQDKKIIVIALTNAVDGPALTLAIGIFKILAYIEKEEEKFKLKPEQKMIDFKEITGIYKSDWGTSLFSQIGSKLVLTAPGADDPTELIQIFKHDKGLRFIAPKKPYGASPGQPIEFIDDSEGEKIFIDSHKGQAKRYYVKY